MFEEEGGSKLTKKMAGYHQFHAVNVAVEETLRAARTIPLIAGMRRRDITSQGANPGGDTGDRRVGVVWHTRGGQVRA